MPPLQFNRRRLLQASIAAWTAGGGAAQLRGAEPTDLVPSVDEQIRLLDDAAPLAMQFTGKTADECLRWQTDFAAKLRELLGPHRPPSDWQSRLERRVERDDHVREERILTAPGHAPLPVHVLLPNKPNARPLAGVIAVHGHGQFAHDGVAGIDDTPERRAEIDRHHYDYGRKLVARGYVVVAPCLTPFGRRLGSTATKQSDPCTLTYLRLAPLGKLLIAENLRDILWSFEALARHEAVDRERIGCVGLSLGGRMTMLAAAVEPRIRVVVISGALNCFQERVAGGKVAGCQMIPGLLQFGDVPEISSLIAPRPCLWEVGLQDGVIPAEWAERCLQRQLRAYAALGAEERLVVDRFEGGHQWNGALAYGVLERTLRR